MELKRYQTAALDALREFLTRAAAKGPADAFGVTVAEQDEAARLEGRKPLPRTYQSLEAMPEVPYVCLRLPTGGGKTLLATEAVGIAAAYLRRELPLTLWMVPSDTIKKQTLEALKNTRHAYRARLDAIFGGRVRVFDIAEFETVRPQDIARFACVIVSTIQSFRVKDTTGGKVYAHHEELEPHFTGLPTEGMETVSEEEAAANDMLRAGAVKFSFANLLYHHRPLMIVDEAHNAVTGLTRVVQERVRPSAIIEFTATPRNRNNLLFSVTAGALKDEEMSAEITEAELSFRRSENVIEIDIEGEKLVYHQTTATQAPLPSLREPDATATEATLVQWLEKQCRARDIPQPEMTAWLARVVSGLVTRRGLSVRTLIDWQYPLATCVRAKIQAIRTHVRSQAHQQALFGSEARFAHDGAAIARFDAESYATVPTQSTGAFRLRKHLLGPSRVPLIDGDLGGEEFQCAWSLDSLDEVDLWIRNLPKHPASFWLPKAEGRFYPDFVARLEDGRIFVVEYKGSHLMGAPDEREKTLLGELWARQTGNVFATVQKMLHGQDAATQMRAAVRPKP